MTEEQLQELFETEVTRLDHERRGTKYHCNLVIPAYDIEGAKFEVAFNLDNVTNTLSTVSLTPTQELFLRFPHVLLKRLEPLLTEKYGSPTHRTRPEEMQDTSRSASFEAVWKFPSTTIALYYTDYSQPTMKDLNSFRLHYEKSSQAGLNRI
ncbi:MAG: hypothetical protein O2968_23460 [Acidobacteria bacterium]|nr:hypothetical protein [Acidobacteriota bacterium]